MAIKTYSKMSEVPTKYRWDLEDILKGRTIESMIDELEKLAKEFIKIKDSKYESSKAYLESLKKGDKISLLWNQVSNYVSNKMNENVVEPKWLQLNETISYKAYLIEQELGAEDPRFFAHSKQIREWIKLKEFKDYKIMLERWLEEEPHQLPKEIQEFRIKESRADVELEQVFSIITDTELKFKPAISTKGKKIEVTSSNGYMLSLHKDPKVRKTAALSFRNAFLQHKESLTNILYQHIKSITVWSKLEKFDSTIDYLTFDDRVNSEFVTTLYDAVQKGKNVFEKYDKYHKKFYKAKFGIAMTKFDHNVELVDVKSEYTIEEMKKETLDAIKPFGKEYYDISKQALNDGWVDYMSVKNKLTGAYSSGVYGVDKAYILMNYDGTLRSVETLAHELGHSMHSYFSHKNNSIRNAHYNIFVAEVASIFNELLLLDNIYKKSKDDKLKFMIKQSLIKGFDGTVLRQVMWSNYEFELYSRIEKGEPISTYEALSKVYYENYKKYAVGKIKPFKQDEQFASFYVPHFYYSFYVYKYAIGQLVANIIFQKYKNEGPRVLQDFIDKFLSVGGSLTPLETIKNMGIDLNDPEVYKLGFKAVEQNINDFVELGKKIFKIK